MNKDDSRGLGWIPGSLFIYEILWDNSTTFRMSTRKFKVVIIDIVCLG